jgi:3-phytase
LLVLAAFCVGTSGGLGLAATAKVAPTVQTKPVPGTGDAADDPCIWIHPTNPSRSTIIGTDKMGGIAVYDLEGKELQYRSDGKMNNVDLRYGFPLGGERIDLVTAGNRTSDTIALYRVNPATRLLEDVAARPIKAGLTVYGSCMYRSARTGRFYFVVNSKTGEVEQWELFDNGKGKVDGRRVRRFDAGGQTEGCVADDELGHLYVGEEQGGIWKYGAEPDATTTRVLVDGGKHFEADVEGLTIYYARGGRGYLIASSQGNSRFVVYTREGDNAYLATFRIAAGNGIDGAEATDGIDVTNVPLGRAFPLGLFVAHDGRNERSRRHTNYKLVPWETIARATDPPLRIDTSWHPRRVGRAKPVAASSE